MQLQIQSQVFLMAVAAASAAGPVYTAPGIFTREEPVDIGNLPSPETIFTDAGPHTICGQWSARTSSGGIVTNVNECISQSFCRKPTNSSIGLCTATGVYSETTYSTDGSCGYGRVEKFIVTTLCPTGNSCQFESKNDLKGKCVTTPADSPDVQTPELQTSLENVKIDEACGLLIEPGKGKYTLAKCSAGLECKIYKDQEGTCIPAPALPPAAVVSSDGRCGYSFDGTLMTVCSSGKCIFPDTVSLSGLCEFDLR
ncbi:hypothetical protein HDU97_008398 [Phlyctochytrium planicorne]|nr:hypothetical protein HDU97_008398 [Phlyctochytrium planicorne]